jgi:aspartate/methionine/tyrosine aminotransferase
VQLARRALAVTPFMVMEVLEAAQRLEAAGRSVIHLEVGEPDFRTPEIIVEAMRRALADGAFKYVHSQGDPELREALSEHYLRHYGLTLHPDRFLICPGASVGLSLLFGALLEPGDGVLISDPHYSCYPNLIAFHGGRPALSPVRESEGFRLRPEELTLGPEIKVILTNSPANPTGAVLGPDRLSALAGLGRLIVSDEIYHGLSYLDERDRSILEFTDHAVVVGGFSKSFAMTGWRVGYLILPPELIRPMRSLAQNFVISVNAAAQKAAAVALREAWPEVEKMRAVYDRRRRLLVDGLRALGLGVMVEPAGAFYVLARADHLNRDSRSLVFEILEQAGVGLTPGVEFGRGAEGFLRFSYAASEESIQEGLRRLARFIGERGPGSRGPSAPGDGQAPAEAGRRPA